MVAARNYQQIEILVRLDQGIGQTQRGLRRDVMVRLADDQEQFPF